MDKRGIAHFDPSAGTLSLPTEEDSITLTLADGSWLTVTGDGIVSLFTDGPDLPVTITNVYFTEDEA